MPTDFDFSDYLAFVWWLVKVSTFVVSVALNVFFVLLLLQIHAGY
jgi:hypothetical protein